MTAGEPLITNLGPGIKMEEDLPESPTPQKQSTDIGSVSDAKSPSKLAGGVGEADARDGGAAKFVGKRKRRGGCFTCGVLTPLVQRLISLIETDIDALIVDRLVDQLHKDLVQLVQTDRGAAPNKGGRLERTRRCVRVYARTQELYRRNPVRLADWSSITMSTHK